jgi:class 3 adenylate cyclase
VVPSIGDAVMATFPTPDRAVAAALRMRDGPHVTGSGVVVPVTIGDPKRIVTSSRNGGSACAAPVGVGCRLGDLLALVRRTQRPEHQPHPGGRL